MINIDERIKLYSEIYGKTYQIASKAIPDNARYIASEIFKEIARDLRSELISELRKENGKDAGPNETNKQKSESKEENGKPATDKQRQALHKFGIEQVPENLGIKEAGEILNILICHLRERDQEAIADIVEKFNKEWV